MIRINVGCGNTPTKGWKNFDNSMSVRFAKIPILPEILLKIGFLKYPQYQFITFARVNTISYGDATKRLPLPDGSVDVFYSSHTLEHLDNYEAGLFLEEAKRVLSSGGIIRLAVPDLNKQINNYIQTKDADIFISATLLTFARPKTFAERLMLLLIGPRNHLWMYDGRSLCGLLIRHGFKNPQVLKAGETLIENPEELDLHERESESVYVEAKNP